MTCSKVRHNSTQYQRETLSSGWQRMPLIWRRWRLELLEPSFVEIKSHPLCVGGEFHGVPPSVSFHTQGHQLTAGLLVAGRHGFVQILAEESRNRLNPQNNNLPREVRPSLNKVGETGLRHPYGIAKGRINTPRLPDNYVPSSFVAFLYRTSSLFRSRSLWSADQVYCIRCDSPIFDRHWLQLSPQASDTHGQARRERVTTWTGAGAATPPIQQPRGQPEAWRGREKLQRERIIPKAMPRKSGITRGARKKQRMNFRKLPGLLLACLTKGDRWVGLLSHFCFGSTCFLVFFAVLMHLADVFPWSQKGIWVTYSCLRDFYLPEPTSKSTPKQGSLEMKKESKEHVNLVMAHKRGIIGRL